LARDITVARLVVPVVAKTQNFAKGLGGATKQAAKWAANIGATVAKFGLATVAAGAAAATGAVLGLGAALAKLTIDAVPLEGIGQAFEAMARDAGLSLESMRKSAAGTVSDFELMRKANVALTGAGEDLSKELGQNLPRLLEIARAASRATGESVDFLFESLVTGVKRSSPMMIDNTGLALRLSEANQAMADSMGVAVDELTAEQKQIAILRATVKAGDKMVEQFGGGAVTAAERLAQFRVQIQNAKDQVGLAFVPALNELLKPINEIANTYGPQLIGWAKEAGTWLGKNMPVFIGIAKSVLEGDLGGAFYMVRGIIKQTFGPKGVAVFDEWVGKIKTFIANARAFIDELTAKFDELRPQIEQAMEGSREVIAAVLGWLETNGPTIIANVLAAFNSFREWFVTNWPTIKAVGLTVLTVYQAIMGALVDTIAQIIPPLQEAFGNITGAMQTLGITWSDVGNAILTALKIVGIAFIAVVTIIWGAVMGVINVVTQLALHISTVAKDMVANFKAGIEAISMIIGGGMAIVKGIFSGDLDMILQGIVAFREGIWNLIKVTMIGVWNTIKLTFGSIFVAVKGFIEGFLNFFTNLKERLVGGSIVPDMMRLLVSALRAGFQMALDLAHQLVEDMIQAFVARMNEFVDAGKAIVEGFIEGVKDKAQKLVEAVKGVVNNAIQAAKNLLGMGSPSRVFMDVGVQSIRGMQIGMERASTALEAAASGAALTAVTAARTSIDRSMTREVHNHWDVTVKTAGNAKSIGNDLKAYGAAYGGT